MTRSPNRPIRSANVRSFMALVSLVALVVVAVPALAAPAEDTVRLEYKFQSGEELKYRYVQRQVATLPIPGMEGMEMRFDSDAHQVLVVDQVHDDGAATLNQTYKSVKVKMETPGGTIEWDSESGDQPLDPNTAIFAALIGKKVSMKMGPRGTISDLDVAELAKAFEENMPMAPGGQDFNAMAEQMVKQGVAELPDQELAVGDSYERTFDSTTPQIGKITFTIVHTLDAIETRDDQRVAVFSLKGSGTLDGAGGGMGLPGAEVELSKCDYTGKMEFQIDRGVVSNLSTKQVMEITMRLDQGGQIMEMTQKIDQEMEQELVGSDAGRPTTPGPSGEEKQEEKKDDKPADTPF